MPFPGFSSSSSSLTSYRGPTLTWDFGEQVTVYPQKCTHPRGPGRASCLSCYLTGKLPCGYAPRTTASLDELPLWLMTSASGLLRRCAGRYAHTCQGYVPANSRREYCPPCFHLNRLMAISRTRARKGQGPPLPT
jgi:hypothetical protein